MTGTLTIIGLGPGAAEHRTLAAEQAVRSADAVVGYGPYLDLCADLLRGDQVHVRGRMGEEEARALDALSLAAGGATVALVSSGDPGVYGMAARTLAAAARIPDGRRPTITVVPGVSAAHAAAALIGAPLGDDWAAISLSDVVKPWPVIERRLAAVAAAGIAVALYNPRSRSRPDALRAAADVLLAERDPRTPAFLVRDAARPDERVIRTTLADLGGAEADMRTIVLVAGDTAVSCGDWVVADRRSEPAVA